MPKRFGLVPVVVCLCLFGPSVPPAHSADVADKKAIVEHARAAYINLRRAGLVDFRASVQPNWNLLLKDHLQNDPAGLQAVLTALNRVHYSMRLDAQDNVTVEHRYDAPAPSGAMAQQFDQISSSVEAAMAGFFQTWASFTLRSPFPPAEGDYQLEDTGAEYRLAFTAGTVNVQTTMSKDFVITRMDLKSDTFSSTVKPQFTKSSIGFALSGYTASYQAAGSADTMRVSVKLDYQVAGGLPLPHTIVVTGDQNGTLTPPSEFELTDYHVTNHEAPSRAP